MVALAAEVNGGRNMGERQVYFHIVNAAGDVTCSIRMDQPLSEDQVDEGKVFTINEVDHAVQSYTAERNRLDVYLETVRETVFN